MNLAGMYVAVVIISIVGSISEIHNHNVQKKHKQQIERLELKVDSLAKK